MALSKVVATFLYGVQANDSISIAAAVIVVALVTGLAAWTPAHRAARINPMAALRNE